MSAGTNAHGHEHVFLGQDHARNERRIWLVIALTDWLRCPVLSRRSPPAGGAAIGPSGTPSTARDRFSRPITS